MRPALLFLAVSAAAQPLTLHYTHPAEDWQSQALPIGNGRLGAMIFGGAPGEHLQLNEDSLWTGDEKDTGAYQNLGDVFFDLSHGAPTAYRRALDIGTALHTIAYTADDIAYHREYFASTPNQAILLRFTADQPGAYTGILRFADAHQAVSRITGNILAASGSLANGLVYATQIQSLNTGGPVTTKSGQFRIDHADALTVIIAARTNYAPDRSKGWRTGAPHERLTAQLRAAGARTWRDLRTAHLADYERLFRRVSIDLGGDPKAGAIPTDERLAGYAETRADP